MEQSPSWKANGSSAGQEIPRILWNPAVHRRVHKSPPLAPILNRIYDVHALQIDFFKNHFCISLPSASGSSLQGSPSKLCMHLYCSNTCHVPCPPRPSCFDHPDDIWWAVQSESFSLCHFDMHTHTANWHNWSRELGVVGSDLPRVAVITFRPSSHALRSAENNLDTDGYLHNSLLPDFKIGSWILSPGLSD